MPSLIPSVPVVVATPITPPVEALGPLELVGCDLGAVLDGIPAAASSSPA